MTIQLNITQLTHLYKTGDGIKNINLQVKKGELVTLLGPSGCGKTTILRSVGGFVQPQAGTISVADQNINDLPPEKRPTAMVFQSYNLWPHMTVYENLAFSMKLRKINRKEVSKKVEWALDLIQLEGITKKYPSELSGGQQQRVALARALLLHPKVLLLDEPFSALDAKLRYELREELREIQFKENVTMLFVTHDQEEALSISDRIVVMNAGKMEQIGTPTEIYDNPKTLFVAKFIGKMNLVDLKVIDRTVHFGNFLYELEAIKSENVIAAIRPEDVEIHTNANEYDFEGTVRKIMLLGHYAEVTIDTRYGLLKSVIEKSNFHVVQQDSKVFVTVHGIKFYEQNERKNYSLKERLQQCLTI